jgi:hypothetical protein
MSGQDRPMDKVSLARSDRATYLESPEPADDAWADAEAWGDE